MAFEHRPGTGSLFVNKNKRPDKQDADFDGRVVLPNGEMHWVKCWRKQSKAGMDFLSISIGAKCERAESPVLKTLDEDIPF